MLATDNIRSSILFDMTQFFKDPLKTGIQKVSYHLMYELSRRHDVRVFIVLSPSSIMVLPSITIEIIHLFFKNGDVSRENLIAYASGAEIGLSPTTIWEIGSFSALINPEVFYDHVHIQFYNHLLSICPASFPVIWILYDALPWMHPEVFSPGSIINTMDYVITAGMVQNRVFISEHARRIFIEKVFRTSGKHDVTAYPGVETSERRQSRTFPQDPVFLAIGTIEPRKNYDLIIGVFERLWREGKKCQLHIIGRLGWCTSETSEMMHQLVNNPQFYWISDGTDDQVRHALNTSSCLIYLSELEGYGLPPIEGLAAGLPVIASAKIPCFEAIKSGGQIRLETVSSQSVYNACISMLDPFDHNQLVNDLCNLELPTWRKFADRVLSLAAS